MSQFGVLATVKASLNPVPDLTWVLLAACERLVVFDGKVTVWCHPTPEAIKKHVDEIDAQIERANDRYFAQAPSLAQRQEKLVAELREKVKGL